MKNVRTALLFGVLIALAAALGLAVQQAPPESTVPSVDNPGPLGLRALYLYLREGGAPVEAHRDSLEALPPGTRTLVIPAPEARPVSDEEVAALEHFVRGGGTLVLLTSHEKKQAQPALALWLELELGPLLPTRERGLPQDTQDVGGTTLNVWLPAGALYGLNGLRVSRDRGITVGRAEAVPLAGLENAVGLWRLGMGQGEVYVAAGTDLAENRRLELLDNLRFWEALATRGPLLFDEFHHASAPPPPLSRGIWAFALQCLAVGALYAVSRGTRFGAPRPLQPVRHRSSREYVASMGVAGPPVPGGTRAAARAGPEPAPAHARSAGHSLGALRGGGGPAAGAAVRNPGRTLFGRRASTWPARWTSGPSPHGTMPASRPSTRGWRPSSPAARPFNPSKASAPPERAYSPRPALSIASPTKERISSTRASQLSWKMRSARVRSGPGPSARHSSTLRTKSSVEVAILHNPTLRTSGMSVDTTGRPAARYSRTFNGLALRVSSLTVKGISATSKARL
ncbi:conserved hypothetical protein [Stigmatella aurantiaca DW4/3-1]|uniref:DUF4350 domain-containing protein n=1 Tax=Stigmatella aurantiaca (strain DW4/3-1) TaxID=378806 RepID=Q097Z6_STIAD|nr:conserved hypothetical protein [Stigmatella aurantiaca DW4/3-1]